MEREGRHETKEHRTRGGGGGEEEEFAKRSACDCKTVGLHLQDGGLVAANQLEATNQSVGCEPFGFPNGAVAD